MTLKIIEAIRRLQGTILEIGLGGGVLSLPAPRTLLLPFSSSEEELEAANVFTFTITEPEIKSVSRDLFASGHYSLSVQEAFKALEKVVARLAGKSASGTTLMEQTFSPNSPTLFWTDRITQSEKDNQIGYHRLFCGAMLGIRNPVTHEFSWVNDADIALELLVFAQHLIRKAKTARRST